MHKHYVESGEIHRHIRIWGLDILHCNLTCLGLLRPACSQYQSVASTRRQCMREVERLENWRVVLWWESVSAWARRLPSLRSGSRADANEFRTRLRGYKGYSPSKLTTASNQHQYAMLMHSIVDMYTDCSPAGCQCRAGCWLSQEIDRRTRSWSLIAAAEYLTRERCRAKRVLPTHPVLLKSPPSLCTPIDVLFL